MVFKKPISAEFRLYVRFLHQEKGVSVAELKKRYPEVSLRSLYRHAKSKKKINETKETNSKKKRTGRPKKISPRDERQIIRTVYRLRKRPGPFSSKRVRLQSGVTHVVDRSVRRVMNKHGLFYLQARKKGLLSQKDRKCRKKFATHMLQKHNENFWKNKVSFYLDGKSFVHKTNPQDQGSVPRARIWRKRSEGLKPQCTTKGSKVGYGGRVVHMMVGISHQKGVIKCQQYEKMSGDYFATFIRKHFNSMFEASGKSERLFLQDGDPSQNSKKALNAMEEVGANLLKIPPRSPDVNPIENFFHLLDTQLKQDALDKGITKESFEKFALRVKKTALNFPSLTIDNIIESMHKRMKMIVMGNGQRLKY